jgi:hypothetical protein
MSPLELAALMGARATGAGQAIERVNRELANEALDVSQRLMKREIYSKPEDRRANGQPKWRRTGQLAARERTEIRGLTVYLVNETPYAEARHEANKPGRRQINPQRTAHWRDDALRDLRPRILAARRAAVLAALRSP